MASTESGRDKETERFLHERERKGQAAEKLKGIIERRAGAVVGRKKVFELDGNCLGETVWGPVSCSGMWRV